MWNSENTAEEWARKKNYLIRSLFEDIPRLSTILEENESRSQFSSNSSTNPRECRPLDHRPASPLPDLYIEVIPKRLCFDESEQFYNTLEKEMRRLYRKDFLSLYDSTNVSDQNTEKISKMISIDQDQSDFNSEDSHISSQNLESEGIYTDLSMEAIDDESESSNAQDGGVNNLNEILHESINHIMSQTFTVASVGEVTETSDSNICEENGTTQITVQTENKDLNNYVNIYYHQPDENSDSLEDDALSKTKRSRLMSTIVEQNETYLQENSEFGEQGISKEFADSSEASSGNNFSASSIPEPEIMRRRKTRRSMFSIPDLYCNSLNTNILDYQNKTLSMEEERLDDEILATGKESCLKDDSPDITEINITSTPKSLKKSFVFSINNRETSKTRFVPYSSSTSSSSRILKTNRGQQTSFSDDEINLHNLWQNFIVGTPTIFKLCSCLNHECF